MRKYTVTSEQAGQRLDKYLMRILPHAPYSLVRKLLRKKAVKLDGARAEGRELLREGEEVWLFLPEEKIEDLTRQQNEPAWDAFRSLCSLALKEIGTRMSPSAIVYEDRDILIVDKPFGVLSQKGADTDISMNEWLIARLWQEAGADSEGGRAFFDSLPGFRPAVCNRLDRNTGGLLLCGKTLRGTRILTRLLRERDLGKYYLAVVTGELSGEGTFRDILYKDEHSRKMLTGGAGRDRSVQACTRYRALRTDNGRTLVEAQLITGKTHQIRAQFAAHGFPLLGDTKYGRKNDRTEGEQKGYPVKKGKALPGQYLYCYRLVFPADGEAAALLPESLRGRELKTDAPAVFTEALESRKY